ncbi:MAG: sigma 54-interacting transcriptional regulator [Proteobacteria bacterium]|nr:sigma 54-interacting transcriptional regulator [Pseudomonadota bacterium]
MALIRDDERVLVESVAAMADTNPFLPAWMDHQQAALGEAAVPVDAVWHAPADRGAENPNADAIQTRVEALAPRLRDRLAEGQRASPRELELYESFVRYLLFWRYADGFLELIRRGESGQSTTGKVGTYRRFVGDVAAFFELEGVRWPLDTSAGPLFEWGYQIRRVFHHTFRQIFGGSTAAAALRAAVWESIFTHDVRRYRRALTGRMNDIPTLVTGESGTGKELVARAIGLSRHIPFDPERQAFVEDYARLFTPLNLSALSPTLIESELFGHRKGAYTGALEDRVGWLQECPSLGAVFLDEIGELDAGIQVKLLRVLQSRTFQRIGETQERRFEGKIIAATNRSLETELAEGRFRQDFYYRLCADRIRTPTLREQLRETPDELHHLVLILARRVAGDDEAPALADEVTHYVKRELGADYAWPGNVRELEQCVRNVLIRSEYRPGVVPGGDSGGEWLAALSQGQLTADALLRRYCTHVYAQTGSYEEAARRLGLDRRTVKARIDADLLAELRGEAGSGEAGVAVADASR